MSLNRNRYMSVCVTHLEQNKRKVFLPYADEDESSAAHFDKRLCCSLGNHKHTDVLLNRTYQHNAHYKYSET